MLTQRVTTHRRAARLATFAETSDDAYARATANDRFVIPDGAHWNEMRSQARDVGQAIQQAMRAIEAANPDRLDGIFGDAPWTNKARLPDSTLHDALAAEGLSATRIGDCLAPSSIADAVHSAHRFARLLGESDLPPRRERAPERNQ